MFLTALSSNLAGSDALDVELCARALVLLGEDAVALVLEDPESYPTERFVHFSRWLANAVSPALGP